MRALLGYRDAVLLAGRLLAVSLNGCRISCGHRSGPRAAIRTGWRCDIPNGYYIGLICFLCQRLALLVRLLHKHVCWD
jgi:hypothetical protein